MIPRLYESTETAFETFGICSLPEAILCLVTEEKNGQYTLELEYPRSGMWFSEIKVDRIILATAHEGDEHAQPFRIERIEGSIGEIVTIYAVHVSYQLNWIILEKMTKYTRYAEQAMYQMKRDALISASCPFNFYSDIGTAQDAPVHIRTNEATPFRSYLGGIEGSVLDTFGGEYEWDRYDVHLWKNRGQDNGVRIIYGKNLIGLDWETDISDTYTSVIATYTGEREAPISRKYNTITDLRGSALAIGKFCLTTHTLIEATRVSSASSMTNRDTIYYYSGDYFYGGANKDGTYDSPVGYEYSEAVFALEEVTYYQITEVTTVTSESSMNDPEKIYLYNGDYFYGKYPTGGTYDSPIGVESKYGFAVELGKEIPQEQVYMASNIATIGGDFAFQRTIVVNTSSEFEGVPTLAQLNSYAANYVKANAVVPTVSFKIKFVPLWQSEEYKEYVDFEKVGLCDTVRIVYPPLGIELQAKVVKTVYNVLLDRYDSIEVSTAKKNLATTIFAMEKQIIRNSIKGGNRRSLT